MLVGAGSSVPRQKPCRTIGMLETAASEDGFGPQLDDQDLLCPDLGLCFVPTTREDVSGLSAAIGSLKAAQWRGGSGLGNNSLQAARLILVS
jgi:hypothetical protein